MSRKIDYQQEKQAAATEDLQAIFTAAVNAHQTGDYTRAEHLYQQVLARCPNNVNLICNLGLLYREMGQPAKALAELQKARSLDRYNFNVNLNIGAIYEDMGDTDQAETAYRQALSIAPQDPRVLNNLGKVLFSKGERDEALTYLLRAVGLVPEYSLAQNNLGVLLSSLGQNDEAIAAFHKALQSDPENPATLYNMAGALNTAGDLAGAARYYRDLLKINPENRCAAHMLAASSGESTEKAPCEYVVDTFDRYSGHFDRQLTERLGYTVPAILGAAVREKIDIATFSYSLDLGCGTGLSGLAFRDITKTLSGVDLSSGMLRKAREKNIYDTLHQADIVDFLDQGQERYDLFIATDVFIYVGNLRPIFSAIHTHAESGAYFAFSIETARQQDYQLRPSGRYAQSVEYIRRLADQLAYDEIHCAPCNIRQEKGNWITGHIFILQVR